MFIRRHWWAVLYAIILSAFTVYIAMDTFVITRVYTVVENENEENSSSDKQSAVAETDSGSNDDEIVGSEAEIETESGSGKNRPESGASGGEERSRRKPDSEERSRRKPGSEDEADGNQSTGNADTADDKTEDKTETAGSMYSDENISITLTEYQEYDTTIYVADITLSSAEYLKTAFAKNAYGRNVTEKTSEIAESADAILAINGDYYGAQETGYVLRNGVIYRSTATADQEDLVIYADGRFEIISENDVTAEELLADGAVQILSFGPALITDGNITVSDSDEVGKAKASNPRTAIGIIDDLHYVFVVSDGRTEESAGLSLSQLAEFMSGLGVETAYNLDGGGSSTMYFDGQVINNPTTNGRSIKERSVSDIVYIGY